MDSQEHFAVNSPAFIPPIQQQYNRCTHQGISSLEMPHPSVTQGYTSRQQQFPVRWLSQGQSQQPIPQPLLQQLPVQMPPFSAQCVPQAQQQQFTMSSSTHPMYQAQNLQHQLSGAPFLYGSAPNNSDFEQLDFSWFPGHFTQPFQPNEPGLLFPIQHRDSMPDPFFSCSSEDMIGGLPMNGNNSFAQLQMFEAPCFQQTFESTNISNFASIQPQYHSHQLSDNLEMPNSNSTAPVMRPAPATDGSETTISEPLNESRKRKRCIRPDLPRELTHNDNMVPPTSFGRKCAVARQATQMKGSNKASHDNLMKYFVDAASHELTAGAEQELLSSKDMILFEILRSRIS